MYFTFSNHGWQGLIPFTNNFILPWLVTNWLYDAFSKLCAAVLLSGEYGCLKLLSCFEQHGDKINGNFALEQY